MSEDNALFKVYPSTPPNGRNNPGCILVTYREQRVYFSITLMAPGVASQALVACCDMIDLHLDSEGVFAIHPECFYRDPADQRPTDEQAANRNSFESQASSLPDNQMRIRKVSRGTSKQGNPLVMLFADPNGRNPDLRMPPKFAKPINAKTGIDWAADVNQGKVSTCDMVVEWKYSDDGQYKNFVRVVS